MTNLNDDPVYQDLSRRLSDQAILQVCLLILLRDDCTPEGIDPSIPIALWPSPMIVGAIRWIDLMGIDAAATQIADMYSASDVTPHTVYTEIMITACRIIGEDRPLTDAFFEEPKPCVMSPTRNDTPKEDDGVIMIRSPSLFAVSECHRLIPVATEVPTHPMSVVELLHTPAYLKWICERLLAGEPVAITVIDTVAELAPVVDKNPTTVSLSDCVNELVQRKIIDTARPGLITDMLKNRIELVGRRVVFLMDDPTDRQHRQSVYVPSTILDTATIIVRNDELHLIGIPGWHGALVVRIQNGPLTATGTEILTYLSTLLRIEHQGRR